MSLKRLLTMKIIHKKGKQTVEVYAGFGQYAQVPSPLCVGAKSVYEGKVYWVHRNWSVVTCKHCLSKRTKKTKVG